MGRGPIIWGHTQQPRILRDEKTHLYRLELTLNLCKFHVNALGWEESSRFLYDSKIWPEEPGDVRTLKHEILDEIQEQKEDISGKWVKSKKACFLVREFPLLSEFRMGSWVSGTQQPGFTTFLKISNYSTIGSSLGKDIRGLSVDP